MSSKPSYSIAIPVYKRVFGFREALQSAVDVTGCSEIIIVDNFSEQDEFEVISKSFNDTRIKYFTNSENVGILGNWNQCAKLASGDFISILCSDDIIESDIDVKFFQAFGEDSTLDVFFGSFAVFFQTKSDARIVKSFPSGKMNSYELLKDMVLNGPKFPILTVSRRKKLLEFPFVEKPHSGNDWLWIYTNASKFRLHAIDQPLSYWRRHDDQDASINQSITQDCWPLMYYNVHLQLKRDNPFLANRAYKRALGFIISSLINDKNRKGYWHTRIGMARFSDNIFLLKTNEMATKNWLSKALLKANLLWPIYYNIARILRKISYYPS